MRIIKLTAQRLRELIKEELQVSNNRIGLPEPIGTTGSMAIDDEFMDYIRTKLDSSQSGMLQSVDAIKFFTWEELDGAEWGVEPGASGAEVVLSSQRANDLVNGHTGVLYVYDENVESSDYGEWIEV